MAPRTLIHAALLAAMMAVIGLAATGRTPAAEPPTRVIQLVGSDASSRFVRLGVDKSVVIDLPRDIKDVLVANPLIANAVIRSARRAYIVGVKIGQTNIYFFDAEGRQIGGFDIAVTRDLNGVRAALKRALPDVDIEGVADGVVLSGHVASPIQAQRAFDIASLLVNGGAGNVKVVNDIKIHGGDQVMIKVTVAEMQRNVIKQLGIDLSGSAAMGSAVVTFNNTNPFSVNGGPINPNVISDAKGNILNNNAGNLLGSFASVKATLRAMEQAGVVRTLAEPTLTAISGESASFVAGGEFPIPSATVAPGATPQKPEFKPFGVILNFTPVVMSEGRISLSVRTEVSEIDDTVAVNGVPGLKKRMAETTVEVPSGGTLAMAGLIKEQSKHNINGLPGLMQVPILGILFKSRDYLNNQTELVILVTPYIVRAVAPKNLSRPDDGFADSTDPGAVLLSRLNRLYGVADPRLRERTYHGNIGFIID